MKKLWLVLLLVLMAMLPAMLPAGVQAQERDRQFEQKFFRSVFLSEQELLQRFDNVHGNGYCSLDRSEEHRFPHCYVRIDVGLKEARSYGYLADGDRYVQKGAAILAGEYEAAGLKAGQALDAAALQKFTDKMSRLPDRPSLKVVVDDHRWLFPQGYFGLELNDGKIGFLYWYLY